MHVRRIPQLWPILGLLLLPWGAGAAPLTLRDCLTRAAAHQTDIVTGQHAVTSAQARATQARSSYFPQIAVGLTKDLIQEGKPGASDDLNTDITVSQTIYDGGQREATVTSAQAAVAQSQAALARTRQTVAFSVTKGYLALLRAQALARVAAQQVAYLDGQLKRVEARIEAGQAAEVDALPIQAQLATARVDALTAANNIRQASIALQQAIGDEPTDDFAIEDVPASAQRVIVAVADALAAAKAHRPELAGSAAAITSAQSGVKAATLKLYPVASVAGAFDQPVGNSGTRTYSISAGLSWSLYNGGKTRAVVQEARAALDSAAARAAQTTRDITAEVQGAVLALDNARERLGATALSVEAARRNVEAQQGRYDQGMAIPLDLVNAQLSAATAQSNAVQAQYDYLTALAQLQFATGQQGEELWK
jgi:outer membrane protein TolC